MRAIVSVRSLRVLSPLLAFTLLAGLVGGAITTRGPQAADARGGGPLAVAGLQSPSPLADSRPPRSPRPGQVVASTPAQTGPSQRPTRSTRPLNSANAATSAGVVASDAALAASNAAAAASNEAATSAGVVASDAAASTSAGVVASDVAVASGSAAVVASDVALASAQAAQAAASASAGVVASDVALASVGAASASAAAASAAAVPPSLSVTFEPTQDDPRSVIVVLRGAGLQPNSTAAVSLVAFDNGQTVRDSSKVVSASGNLFVTYLLDCDVYSYVTASANTAAGYQITDVVVLTC
jgi:trimeric autotransporter adhesin